MRDIKKPVGPRLWHGVSALISVPILAYFLCATIERQLLPRSASFFEMIGYTLAGAAVAVAAALVSKTRPTLIVAWSSVHLGTTWVLYRVFRLLDRVVRSAPRFGPLWYMLGVLILLLAVHRDRLRDRPILAEVQRQVAVLATDSPLDPSSWDDARRMFALSAALDRNRVRVPPGMDSVIESLRTLYGGLVAPTDDSIRLALTEADRKLDANATGVDDSLTTLLRVCLRARIRLVDLPESPDAPTLESIGVVLNVAGSGPPATIPAPGDEDAALIRAATMSLLWDSWTNSMAIVDRLRIRTYDSYAKALNLSGRAAPLRKELYNRAKSNLTKAPLYGSRSTTSQLRRRNNLADLELVYLCSSLPKNHGRIAPPLSGTEDATTTLDSVSSDLVRSIGKSTSPRVLLTLSQVAAMQAHVRLQAARTRMLTGGEEAQVIKDLRAAADSLVLARALGLDPALVLTDSHAVGYCWMLSNRPVLQGVEMSPTVRSEVDAARAKIQASLPQLRNKADKNRVDAYECPFCRGN